MLPDGTFSRATLTTRNTQQGPGKTLQTFLRGQPKSKHRSSVLAGGHSWDAEDSQRHTVGLVVELLLDCRGDFLLQTAQRLQVPSPGLPWLGPVKAKTRPSLSLSQTFPPPASKPRAGLNPMLGNNWVTLLRDKSLNFMPEGQFLSLSPQFPPTSSLLPERKINDFAGGKGEISSRIKTHEQNTHVTARRMCFACKYHTCKVKMSHFTAALALGTE